jgi:DNA replication licensing factor MCM6
MHGNFTCNECRMSTVIHQQFRYTEPTGCANCQNRVIWKLNLDQSVFVDWQRVRVQENADEIPPGVAFCYLLI